MARCLECKNIMFCVEPFENVDIEGNTYMDYSKGSYHCKYDYKKFDVNKEINCRKFEERKIQCRVCKKMIPVKDFGGITCGSEKCVKKAELLFGKINNKCF